MNKKEQIKKNTDRSMRWIKNMHNKDKNYMTLLLFTITIGDKTYLLLEILYVYEIKILAVMH